MNQIEFQEQLLCLSILQILRDINIMRTALEKRRKLFNSLPIPQKTLYFPISLSPYHPSSHCPSTKIDEQSFSYEYLQFMTDHPYHQDLKEKLKYLYILYSQICERGGFIRAVGERKLDDVIEELKRQIPSVKKYSVFMIFEHYKLYLFDFEVVMKLNTRISGSLLSHYGLVTRFQGKQFSKPIFDQSMSQDIVLVQDFCEAFGIRSNMCALDSLIQYYKHQKIDPIQITIQSQLLIISQGIYKSQEPRKLYTTFPQLYNLIYNISQPGSSTIKVNSQQILTCFKFDPKDECLEQQIFGAIKNKFFSYKSLQDLFCYSDEDIPGVTFPVFRILTEKSRQGPSQEPYGSWRIDINMGEGDVMWFCVPEKDIEKLRKILLKEHDFDLFRLEREWWADIDWLILNGINIKSTLQRKNEAIIIGPGSLYWYESLGISVHSGWNKLTLRKQQHQAFSAREKLNKELLLNPQPIPIKSLTLQYLNHQSPKDTTLQSTDYQKLMHNSLKAWLQDEEKYLNQLIIKCDIGSQKIQYYRLYNLESFCVECRQEILVYFVRHYSNMVNGISCLQCFKNGLLKYSKQKNKGENSIQIENIRKKAQVLYHRYDQFNIHQLINSYNKPRKPTQFPAFSSSFQPQFLSLCQGQYIGQLATKCQKIAKNHPLNELQCKDDFQKMNIIENEQKLAALIDEIQKQDCDQFELKRRECLNSIIMQCGDENEEENGNSFVFSSIMKKTDACVQTQFLLFPPEFQDKLQPQLVKCSSFMSHSSPQLQPKIKLSSEMIDEEQQEQGTKATRNPNSNKIIKYHKTPQKQPKRQRQRNSYKKEEKKEVSDALYKLMMMQSREYDQKQSNEKSEYSCEKGRKRKKMGNEHSKYRVESSSEAQDNIGSMDKSDMIPKEWMKKYSNPKHPSKDQEKTHKLSKKYPNAQIFNYKLEN